MSDAQKWFLGSMNDALFIIDGPPRPAPDDTGPYNWPGAPNPVSAAIDDRNGKLIVEAHNAALTAAIEAERTKIVARLREMADTHYNERGMSAWSSALDHAADEIARGEPVADPARKAAFEECEKIARDKILIQTWGGGAATAIADAIAARGKGEG